MNANSAAGGITLWSNGVVEVYVNHLKMLKCLERVDLSSGIFKLLDEVNMIVKR